MDIEITLPKEVELVLEKLEQAGYEAFAVGGCIRDSLLNKKPSDWDITTSALPEEMQIVFEGFRIIPTGIRHGTITVQIKQASIEITTYRIDGQYSDSRHPDAVQFTKNLHEDLSRRDFTINALAYSPSDGLIDYFNGMQDLENCVIRCVGKPVQRFQEDSLRILRALRFASVLSFSIEASTANGMKKNKKDLSCISQERINSELLKLLCGNNAEYILREYSLILAEVLPEIKPCIGFDQHSRYHIYDVWEHTIHAVSAIAPEPILRLSALLHDIGKPECYSMDTEGHGHFYGHQKRSAEIAERVLRRLKLDNYTISTVTTLVKYHDVSITDSEKGVRRWLCQLGEPLFRLLLQLNHADTLAHAKSAMGRLDLLEKEEQILNRILADNVCFNLKMLMITGTDLLAIGVPQGREVGQILQQLLDAVLEQTCPNEKESLLALAQCIIKK